MKGLLLFMISTRPVETQPKTTHRQQTHKNTDATANTKISVPLTEPVLTTNDPLKNQSSKLHTLIRAAHDNTAVQQPGRTGRRRSQFSVRSRTDFNAEFDRSRRADATQAAESASDTTEPANAADATDEEESQKVILKSKRVKRIRDERIFSCSA